jgi:hypothetical protein
MGFGGNLDFDQAIIVRPAKIGARRAGAVHAMKERNISI